MITLAYGGTTLTLPEDLRWSDQQNWQPVAQNVGYSITGAVIVDVAAKLAGRPITLQPEDAQCAWMTKTVLDTLLAWAAVPGRQFVLNVLGTAYDVIFRHQDGAIEATPVIHYNTQTAGDFWLVTLRFMGV